MRVGWAIVCVAAALIAAAPAQAADPATPWESAERIQRALFSAQEELILGSPARAEQAVRRARAAYRGELRRSLRAEAPAADRTLRRAFTVAERAARRGDRRALAAARGEARAATYGGAYTVTLNRAGRGDAAAARSWLLLRDFRTATRFTRPGADATAAVGRLADGKLEPRAARLAVAKDLLDAYQARQRELLKDADAARERGFAAGEAEAAAQAAGYWDILDDRYRQDRGAPAAEAATEAFAELRAAAERGDEQAAAHRPRRDRPGARRLHRRPLHRRGVRAARPAAAALRRARAGRVRPRRQGRPGDARLRGPGGDRVRRPPATPPSTTSATSSPSATPRPPSAVGVQLDRLAAVVTDAARKETGVTSHDDVEALGKKIEDELSGVMPKAWLKPTDDSDYDLIALTLDRMEAAVGAGQRSQAEQARLEAYAFFEFGPERRLKSIDPGLATDIEGLVWFGAKDQDGLAELISKGASRREVRETRLVLDDELEDARATLGDSASRTTVVTNAAIIVFREGLEAVLILAAITASFVGVRRRLRRPVLVGAALGLVASLFTWVLAQTLLESLSQYGEKLEAVVGLIAIGVLLLITNWFFHRVYWSEWIGRFHRQRRKLLAKEKVGFWSAQAAGLLILGLTSVYREGFETVLFLQSLELSAGTAAVIEGAALGLALTLGVAVLTFVLQRKLPYKKMLIATGGLIGLVLVVMVGQTARTMQGTGWLPITPLDWEIPSSFGLWFGIFPSVETIGAQIAAIVVRARLLRVATEIKVKRPQRKAARKGVEAPRAAEPAEPPKTPVAS